MTLDDRQKGILVEIGQGFLYSCPDSHNWLAIGFRENAISNISSSMFEVGNPFVTM